MCFQYLMRPVLRFHMRLLIDSVRELPLASPLLQFGLLAFMSTSANFLYHTQTHSHTLSHTVTRIFSPHNVAHKSLALKSAAGDVSVSVCAGH